VGKMPGAIWAEKNKGKCEKNRAGGKRLGRIWKRTPLVNATAARGGGAVPVRNTFDLRVKLTNIKKCFIRRESRSAGKGPHRHHKTSLPQWRGGRSRGCLGFSKVVGGEGLGAITGES